MTFLLFLIAVALLFGAKAARSVLAVVVAVIVLVVCAVLWLAFIARPPTQTHSTDVWYRCHPPPALHVPDNMSAEWQVAEYRAKGWTCIAQ